MEAFKRGFVQKCAEYGFDKEAAKELFKKMKKNLAAHEAGESAAKEMKEEACAKTAADVTPAPGIMELLKTYAPELIGGGVGAGLGAGAGAMAGDEENKGRNMGLGALAGGALGAGAGHFTPDLLKLLAGKEAPATPPSGATGNWAIDGRIPKQGY